MFQNSVKKMAFVISVVIFSFTILFPLSAEAAISFVQKVSNTTSSARSLALTLPASVTAENLLVVSVSGWPNLPASTAVTDSLGNSYAPAGNIQISQGAYSAIYYAQNVKGGSDTVTFTTVDSGGQISMVVAEFSGVDTVSPLDKISGATGSGSTPSSGAMTPTMAGSLIIGSGTHNGSTVTTTGSGFTMIAIPTEDSDTHQPLAMEYLVLSGTDPVAATFNLATAYPWTQNGVIFKPSTPPVTTGSYSIWSSTTIPGTVDSGPDSSVELGVKFKSDISGSITGIRFYKASTNTGDHVANLWNSSGARLATATFSSESASGWQQVNFSTPVAVTADTVYVASYHTNVGHYSDDQNFFTGRSADNPPLHALADSNGVYAYGSNSSFPSQSWNNTNYWVDVVFSSDSTPVDTTSPSVTAFTIPATSSSLTVAISSFTATDNVGVSGYLLTESATAPSATASGWTTSAPASYTFATAGIKTLYAWARDAAGNVSASRSATVSITLVDTTPPTVTAFTIPTSVSTLTVPVNSFSATDNVAVSGYLLTESTAVPSATASGWTTSAPASYTFATAGSKTLYAWAKDAAGNVSTSRSATVVVVTVQSGGPEPVGWYSGDMHVHRSCGDAPEATSSIFQKMDIHKLSFASLLADMGNGEVQDPYIDLPLVTGRDVSISTPEKILRWDAEWHWDPTYWQYPHQALGGHVVALGLLEGHQIWEEYTYPIFDWARQQNGIAGFAHMQYLDGGIPQSLNCCIPLEYPVEVALGAADFISEDVVDIKHTVSGMNPEAAMQAYYKLLNCGFRPGLAAGTDYPCTPTGTDVGALLTYVQVADGDMTYNKWIDGIAKGRTVVSRNGHMEFLDLKVNGTAAPGDEIKLTGSGSVQVTINWTAIENLSGTMELLQNGVVIASKQASVSSTAPATLSTTVVFAKSGWLAARRMGSNGHAVHTAAVFVSVNNAPVRASVEDANFYVQWMDNLLTKTSPGGAWSSYFSDSRSQAQARYQSAKTLFQQIALEAGETTPPPTSTEATIFTTQTPGIYDNDAVYELGTKFSADINGRITQTRIYTNAQEGGNHTVRIWRVSDGALLAGPYTWNITAGSTGWKSFTLPSALTINANTDYIVAVSNSSDRQYAAEIYGFDAPIVNGYLRTYVGSGVYSESPGTMPTSIWGNSSYFRDVVFVP